MRSSSLVLSLACSLLIASGCGDDGDATSSTGGSAATGGSGGSGGDGASGGGGAGTGGAPEPCTNVASNPANATCILEVRGRVVDEQGAGVGEKLVSACGPENCNPGETDTSGDFVIDVGLNIVSEEYSTLLHGRPTKAAFYFQLPLDPGGEMIEMGELVVLELPADGPLLTVKTDDAGSPAQSVTSNGVTLEVEAGVSIVLDVEDVISGDEGKEFKVVEVPPSLHSNYVGLTTGIVSLFAFSPFDVSFQDDAGDAAKARVILPNTTGLAANAPVEVLVLGSFLFPDYVFPATFEPVATGKVSADGLTIELDPGEGLDIVTWVGVREAQ